MTYNPQLPAGQSTAATSAPVVQAADSPVPTDFGVGNQIDDIRNSVMGLAATRGIAADLRTTIINSPAVTITSGTVTTVTTVTTVSTVTNQAQIGGYAANVMIANLQNQTYAGAFSVNITRP
jgi:hypothetical protein